MPDTKYNTRTWQ